MRQTTEQILHVSKIKKPRNQETIPLILLVPDILLRSLPLFLLGPKDTDTFSKLLVLARCIFNSAIIYSPIAYKF
jgi:hypothetical protein